MKYRITHAIEALAPLCGYSLTGYDYDTVIWHANNPLPQPTEAAVNAKIAELDAAEPMRLLRIERDERLQALDWRVTYHASRNEAIPTPLSDLMQALRDLPTTATPTLDENFELDMDSVTWPVEATGD